MEQNCVVCGVGQKERPMCFRNEDYCSDLCRKFVNDEITADEFSALSGKGFNHETGIFDMSTATKLLTDLRKNGT